MRTLLIGFLVSAMTATAQTPATDDQQPQTTTQQQTTPEAQPKDQNRDRSVLNVKPGAEAIKPKDYYERSGTLHPFRRMPKFILVDQYKIWTSPFHTSKSDAKW
jgi:hypothetical protein